MFFSVLLIWSLLQPLCAYGSLEAKQYIDNGGFIVSDDSGRMKYREQDLFIPASTLKILTCLVALDQLGKDYRFETHFFLDGHNNLYIKGYGDPFLTSEAILEIGTKLAGLGVQYIKSLFLDESSFALNGETAGIENSANPYDAPNGALAVNFNALPVEVNDDRTIDSGEPQTPVINLMSEAGASLLPGRYRINIDTLSRSGLLSPTLRYTGELFTGLFKQAGISINKGYSKKSVPKGLKPIFIYRGIKSLDEIIRACLKNSNNFIANQLFLTCGVKSYGLPATWDKSRKTFALFIKKTLQLSPMQIAVFEGSGLSRQNRVSPASLLTILNHFKPYSELLHKQSDILLKSGTMKDVYCYVGYFPQGNNLIPFAILLNQTKNNRAKILEVLHAAFLQQKPRQANQ